jgi:IS5 family transposase
MYRAIEKLVALAKRTGVPLRGRYNHAHQFKGARRMLKFLRTRLGRLIRDIGRKIDGDGSRPSSFLY